MSGPPVSIGNCKRLAEAWPHVNVPVLAVHGEYDWIMSPDDYKLLTNE